MAQGSDRINLIGLSLSDSLMISDELRRRSVVLREGADAQRKLLAEVQEYPNSVSGCEAIISAIEYERERVATCREALVEAIAQTFNNLG